MQTLVSLFALAALVGMALGAFGAFFNARSLFSHVVTPGLGNLFSSNQVLSAQNGSEVLRQTLYDHLLYPGGGSQALSFFTAPQNQGVTSDPSATVGDPKNIRDTNMVIGGMLSSGLAFLVEEISIYFYPGSSNVANTFTPVLFGTASTDALSATTVNAVHDVKKFYESGLLTFNILQKQYCQETPLRIFPPQTRIVWEGGYAAANLSTDPSVKLQAGNVYPIGRNFALSPCEISLQPAVQFNVILSWASAYATASANNGRVGVEFGGMLMRAAQ